MLTVSDDAVCLICANEISLQLGKNAFKAQLILQGQHAKAKKKKKRLFIPCLAQPSIIFNQLPYISRLGTLSMAWILRLNLIPVIHRAWQAGVVRQKLQ